MNNKIIIIIFSILAIIYIYGNTTKTFAAVASEELNLLFKDTNWKKRADIIKKISKQIKESKNYTKELQKVIIELLKKEINFQEEYRKNSIKQGKSSKGTEIDKMFDNDYGKYGYWGYFYHIVDLAYRCDNLNEAMIKFFLTKIPYTQRIIWQGKDIIPILKKFVNSKDKDLKISSYYVLSIWINNPYSDDFYIPNNLLLTSKEKLDIKPIFLNGIKDIDREIRFRSVYGLGAYIDDKDIIILLRNISKIDSDSGVREEAASILKKVENK